MKTILIIEDDSNLSRGIAFSLEKEGFVVYSADNLNAGRNIFNKQDIDLIILDLNLPDGDGMDFCMEVRQKSDAPILMLTVRDLEADELAGLAAGADDYITKPFSVSILRARVQALLRRFDITDKNIFQSGAFKLHTNNFKLFHGEKEIPISATEFRILRLLMDNAGKVLSKGQISDVLWENADEYIDDNALSVNISRLRSKIEANPKKPAIIKTIHGIGYVWTGE